jgi:hypothetical protein
VLAVIGAVVVAALLMTAGAIAAVRSSRASAAPSHPAALPTVPDPDADAARYDAPRAAILAVFQARQAALTSGDLAAWMATVDPRQPTVQAYERQLFANLRQLPLSSYAWSYDPAVQVSGYPVPDSVRSQLGDPTDVYIPGMRVTYRFRGFDPQATWDQYAPVMVERAGRWYVGADRTRDASFDMAHDEPWTAGPIQVRVTKHVLVVVSAKDAGRLATLAGQADAAVAAVTSLWGTGWSHTAVLFATREPDVFASFLGRDRAVSEASGVTLGLPDDAVAPAPQDTRVIVNPGDAPPGDPFMPVLLRHEFTHVAQWNSQADGTPRWVIEGIAQYTAYRHHLSRALVSRQIVNDAKAHRWRLAMPASSTFYGSDPAQELHYDMSWLAWEYVAERYGEKKLKTLYGRLATITAPLDSTAALRAEAAAFPAVLHTSESAFVTAVETWTARSFQPA